MKARICKAGHPTVCSKKTRISNTKKKQKTGATCVISGQETREDGGGALIRTGPHSTVNKYVFPEIKEGCRRVAEPKWRGSVRCQPLIHRLAKSHVFLFIPKKEEKTRRVHAALTNGVNRSLAKRPTLWRCAAAS